VSGKLGPHDLHQRRRRLRPEEPQIRTSAKQHPNTNDQQVVEETDPSKGARINFSLPWRVGRELQLRHQPLLLRRLLHRTQRQSVLFNGDLNVFKYWKLGFSSGYDLWRRSGHPPA
jgi:hypothetical protein